MRCSPLVAEKLPDNKLVKQLGIEEFVDKDTPSACLEFTVGCWRKANAIHAWFVSEVQDGSDDCGTYYVGKEQLEQLKLDCLEVINNPDLASEKLPTQSGFFFGDTGYNEYYFQDLKDTVEIIDKCLKMPSEWSFNYHSSW